MRHMDLFSGIGGFAHAARVVWGDDYENVGFCEIDPFCQAVLRKNFPDCQIIGDIRTLTYAAGAGLERSDWEELPLTVNIGCIDLITGGFPCQPFSAAGRRRGTSDDRYLWPEMFRVIQRFKPSWVIAENVSGLLTWNKGMVLEQVCSDLESQGYEVQPFVIPAVAVNAPHRRDRVWVVAHSIYHRLWGAKRSGFGAEDSLPQEYRSQNSVARQLVAADNDWHTDQLVAHYDFNGLQEPRPQQQASRHRQSLESHADWNRDWREVALATCLGGMDDGLSRKVVRLPNGSEINHARWRKEALKAYGNAIVPQVAIQILEAIKGV